MLTLSCTSHESELKNNTQTKPKNTHTQNKIKGLTSQSAEALLLTSEDKHIHKNTHPSFRPLQRAGWGDIGSWSRTRRCYSSQLPARSTKREKETHYDCDFRHCGCGQDSQTLLRADRIQFIISGKINGPLFLQYFQKNGIYTHTHTSQNSREIWSFDHLFLWHFASFSLFILLFKTLCGFAKVGFSSCAWSSCLHASMWTSNMHECLQGKLTKRIEDAHWQFEKTEWGYLSWTIILKNNCPKESEIYSTWVTVYITVIVKCYKLRILAPKIILI